MNNNDIIERFNLPSYVKNKSFADSSKLIQRRFKGREDIESKNTEKDLLDRLRQAQEALKAQEQAKQQAAQQAKAIQQGDAVIDDTGQVINRLDPAVQNGSIQPNQPPQPPQIPQQIQTQMQDQQTEPVQQPQQGLMDQIQSALGGKMNKCADGGYLQGDANLDGVVDSKDIAGKRLGAQNTSSATDITGGAIGAAGTLANLGTQAFGKTGIDTSGATSTAKESLLGATGSGAMQGAQAGAAIGKNLDPVTGAIVTGTGALIGGGLGLLSGTKQNKDAQKSQVANTYMKASQENRTFANGGPLNKYDEVPDILSGNYGTSPNTDYYGVPPIMSGNIPPGVNPEPTTAKVDYNKVPDILSGNMPAYSGTDTAPNVIPPATPTTMDKITSAAKSAAKGTGKLLSGSGEALRYAPLAMDAYQLAKLKRARSEGTARLDARYKPQYSDENALMNVTREELNAARGAIRETAGGSPSEARANLLATQLQSMKGLSAASAAAREANAQERRQAQQFNLGVDQANIQQANLQQDILARNLGAYETQKSKLLASLGTSAGEVGKEELYKKYPEMMGLSYGWRGKYAPPTEEEMQTLEEIRKKNKAKTTYSKTGATKTSTEDTE